MGKSMGKSEGIGFTEKFMDFPMDLFLINLRKAIW
jgi:hypothetical protein